MLDLRRGVARRGPPTVMSQPFRRQPIAALMANEGTVQARTRALGAGDLMMRAMVAVIGAGERFGARLPFGLTLHAVPRGRHSTRRGA